MQPHYNDDEASAAIAVYEDLSDTPDEEDIEKESEESEDEDEDENISGKVYVACW